MNIKYGKVIKETVYINGEPREEPEKVVVRDLVTTDAEELALFIRFQKESASSRRSVFTREHSKSATGKINRYAVREWEV